MSQTCDSNINSKYNRFIHSAMYYHSNCICYLRFWYCGRLKSEGLRDNDESEAQDIEFAVKWVALLTILFHAGTAHEHLGDEQI